MTAGEEIPQAGQWIKDLAAAHRTFVDRLADRLSLTIPLQDPDYGPPRCPGSVTRPPRASPAKCSPRSKRPGCGPALGARPWPGSTWPWR
jgi:hypothetical protein